MPDGRDRWGNRYNDSPKRRDYSRDGGWNASPGRGDYSRGRSNYNDEPTRRDYSKGRDSPIRRDYSRKPVQPPRDLSDAMDVIRNTNPDVLRAASDIIRNRSRSPPPFPKQTYRNGQPQRRTVLSTLRITGNAHSPASSSRDNFQPPPPPPDLGGHYSKAPSYQPPPPAPDPTPRTAFQPPPPVSDSSGRSAYQPAPPPPDPTPRTAHQPPPPAPDPTPRSAFQPPPPAPRTAHQPPPPGSSPTPRTAYQPPPPAPDPKPLTAHQPPPPPPANQNFSQQPPPPPPGNSYQFQSDPFNQPPQQTIRPSMVRNVDREAKEKELAELRRGRAAFHREYVEFLKDCDEREVVLMHAIAHTGADPGEFQGVGDRLLSLVTPKAFLLDPDVRRSMKSGT